MEKSIESQVFEGVIAAITYMIILTVVYIYFKGIAIGFEIPRLFAFIPVIIAARYTKRWCIWLAKL
jgi:hypothetical protein